MTRPCSPCPGGKAQHGAGQVTSPLKSRSPRLAALEAKGAQTASLPDELPDRSDSPSTFFESLANSSLYWISVWSVVLFIACYAYFTSNSAEVKESMAYTLSMRDMATCLPRNLWSLILVSAVGQVKVGKTVLDARWAVALSMVIGLMQVVTLFLVVHDINPAATPVTVVSSASWIKSCWSVNMMKWLMVSFLSIDLSKDSSESRTLLQGIMETNRRRLQLPRSVLCSVCSLQYIIVIMVVWCGVSAVLSFQAVPDILYSSMAVTFLSRADEAVYELINQVFNIKADFVIVHGRPKGAETIEELFQKIDADGDGNISREELESYTAERFTANDEDYKSEDVPVWLDIFFRVLVALPVVLGFGLITRAFMTNVMPTKRVHLMKDIVVRFLWGHS
mmetsp:Transcript_65027/g.179689  ORF Transcript_65027/g.179689 Transcript_65027/m.179689 type:complete len:393 (+) Transcript_65027:2-1180(+)